MAAQYGNIFENLADQYNTLGGGNPILIPETADTLAAGIVWTPQGIPRLSITLDYYNIDITDVVDTIGADSTSTICLQTGNPDYCSLIHRDARGSLWLSDNGHTRDTFKNIGQRIAQGIDLNFKYLIGLGKASYLSTDLMGAYLMQATDTNPALRHSARRNRGRPGGRAGSGRTPHAAEG